MLDRDCSRGSDRLVRCGCADGCCILRPAPTTPMAAFGRTGAGSLGQGGYVTVRSVRPRAVAVNTFVIVVELNSSQRREERGLVQHDAGHDGTTIEASIVSTVVVGCRPSSLCPPSSSHVTHSGWRPCAIRKSRRVPLTAAQARPPPLQRSARDSRTSSSRQRRTSNAARTRATSTPRNGSSPNTSAAQPGTAPLRSTSSSLRADAASSSFTSRWTV